MKADGLLKHVAIAFGIAVAVYYVCYTGIEHRRTRRGPWQVVFGRDSSGSPVLVINQPSLAISNVQILFSGQPPTTNADYPISFRDPRPVPFDVPFGKCVFEDTTFLPGTIVLELFGHEVQLLPRVLTIDKQEQSWKSQECIRVSKTNGS